MAQRTWPVALVAGLLVCLSLACASLARIPTPPPATASAALAATTAAPAPTETVSSAPAADTATPVPPASATLVPTAAQLPSATPSAALAATVTAVDTQTGLGHTGPSDIPVIEAATTRILTATDMQVVYQTDADRATLIKYYTDQMPLNGWTLGGTSTLAVTYTTTMTFTKDNRTASVSFIAPPGVKQVTVTIVIVGK